MFRLVGNSGVENSLLIGRDQQNQTLEEQTSASAGWRLRGQKRGTNTHKIPMLWDRLLETLL